MRKELKDPWIKALRSGLYDQDAGYLKTDYGYCCLGVLCHINKIPIKTESTLCGLDDPLSYSNTNLKNFMGIDDDQFNHLIDMNDSEGRPFEEIADYIEQTF